MAKCCCSESRSTVEAKSSESSRETGHNKLKNNYTVRHARSKEAGIEARSASSIRERWHLGNEQHLDLIHCAIIPACTIIKPLSFLLLCYSKSNSFHARLFRWCGGDRRHDSNMSKWRLSAVHTLIAPLDNLTDAANPCNSVLFSFEANSSSSFWLENDHALYRCCSEDWPSRPTILALSCYQACIAIVCILYSIVLDFNLICLRLASNDALQARPLSCRTQASVRVLGNEWPQM